MKLALLNGLLEEIYADYPPWYDILGHENKVYKLLKVLYGLKKASRAWYSRINSFLLQNGFNRCNSKATLYTNINEQGEIVIVCLYVNDFIFMVDLSIDMLKTMMKKEVEITNLGLMRYFLGIEVNQNEKGITQFTMKVCELHFEKV